jgi:hypothetical protein
VADWDVSRRIDIVLTIPDDKVPKAGTGIAVPVDDGREWWEMGEIITTSVESDGRIRVSIELAPGMELVACVPTRLPFDPPTSPSVPPFDPDEAAGDRYHRTHSTDP